MAPLLLRGQLVSLEKPRSRVEIVGYEILIS